MNEHKRNIEIRIFCDGDVHNAFHKLKIGYIAYDRMGGILAKPSKYKNRDSPFMAQILAVEAALELALVVGGN